MFDGDAEVNFVYTVTPGNVRLQLFLIQIPGLPIPEIDNYVPANYDFKIVAVAGTLPAGG